MTGKSRKTLTAVDTIFPVAFGISPAGAIRRTFHSNLPETGKHGWEGSLKLRNTLAAFH